MNASAIQGANTHRLGESLVHEADHWDFNMNAIPRLHSEMEQPLSSKELIAISEKRAYLEASLPILPDVNYFPKNGNPQAIAARHPNVPPEAFLKEVGNDMLEEYGSSDDIVNRAVVAAVVAEMYGKPDQLMTPEEMTLYKRYGFIHPNHH